MEEYFVKYIGVIKTTGFTPIDLFKYLLEGEIYKVGRIIHRTEGDYYFISFDRYQGYWYPVENFNQTHSRDYIMNKYGLK